MRLSDADILFVPGKGNSGPGHWQRRWAERFSTGRVVEQENWRTPEFEKWTATLQREIMMATRPVILIGHSLGVTTIAHAALRLADTKVRGALLVAPSDPERARGVTPAVRAFAPVPTHPLPFPSMLIASSNDIYCTLERAAEFASAWGSDFHIAGEMGHINADSGHGPWPEGLMMLTRLMQRLRA